MPYLTLGQASKETGKAKATILNAINKQRLSAKKNDKNQWDIDPAELFRVYPPNTPNSTMNNQIERGQTEEKTVLNVEIEYLKKINLSLEKQLEEEKGNTKDWKIQLEDTKRRLTNDSQKTATGQNRGLLDSFKKFFGTQV